MTKKKEKKSSKSTKDKTRNAGQDISGPKGGTDGLYIKLVQHQRQISAQMQMMTSAVDNGVKTSLTAMTTSLLIQVDSAVTTTHHCLTKETCDKIDGVKSRMEASESVVYSNVAKLVKWADFDSRSSLSTVNGKMVRVWIKEFETALGNLVKLVEETQSQLSGSAFTDTVQRQRRSSVGSTSILPSQPLEVAPHPQLSAVKGALADGGGRDRKISLPVVSTQPPMIRMAAGKPSLGRDSLGSMLSESSTSDEEKRRSGSNDRVSPERHDLTTSAEWNGRNRSGTEPVFTQSVQIPYPTHHHHLPTSPPHRYTSYSVTAPTSGVLTDMDRAPLPPLHGELSATSGWRNAPALPYQRQVYTMPRRASESPKMNGRWSPEPRLMSQQPGSVATDDEPPPIPVKQKKRMNQMNGQPRRPKTDDYDDLPPPIPMKQRKATSATSPPTTPSHAPSSSHTSPVHMNSRGVERPPMVPVRLDSIMPRGALHSEPAPPKPPRTDRPPVVDQPPAPPMDKVASTIRAVRRYNEDLMKGRAGPEGEEVAPPIPLKKKTVMMYKELVQGYQFDDTIMQPLYIPMAETGPPALPPKKKNRRKQTYKGVSVGRDAHTGASPEKPIDQRSSMASSVEDLADDTDAEEVNYLECEDTSGYLTFHKEVDGGYTLRGGPLDALIAYAASTTNAVKQFTEAFLLTYYTFITPEELISKLLTRLSHFYHQRNQPVWTATISLLVRLLNNLNQPLVQEAEVRLIEMVHQMLSDGHLKFAQLLRNALVAKLNQLIPVKKPKTAPLVGPGFKSNRKFAVTDFTPEELARQMTVLDNELFQKVDVAEMLYWAKEQNEEKSPLLTHFTMHFNNVSQWTKARILERGVDMRGRVKIVLHFVAIMKALRETFNNFNSYLAILSAVESSPISRLDWPDRVVKSLEEPRALIDNKGSFKNYREAFATAKPPCIPYIGLYLQDLTFIEMQPKTLEDGVSINFTKRWKQFKSVDHIRFAQTKQYTFDPNPDILSLFANFENCATDEELWALSNEIKPSARAQRAQQQST